MGEDCLTAGDEHVKNARNCEGGLGGGRARAGKAPQAGFYHHHHSRSANHIPLDMAKFNIDLKSLTEATSAAVGGVISTALLYPLDTCKTKYQVEAADRRSRKYK